MKRYKVKTGKTAAGKSAYALEPAPHLPAVPPVRDPATQPVSRQDILNLQEALVWPPESMRDVNLTEMENQRKALNSVWEDPYMDPTSKLLKASLHSQLFAVANKKYFSRGEKGENFLPPTYQTPPPLTPAQESQTATPQDQKQTHSLIPRYRGTPLSVTKSIVNVPHHLKNAGTQMVMALKSPDSRLAWDSEGKLIDKIGGERGKGKIIQGTNIQDILGYATNPSPHINPPKGYSEFRDALIVSGLRHMLTPESEELFKVYKKRTDTRMKKSKKSEQYLQDTLTPGSTLKLNKNPVIHRLSSTPTTHRSIPVKSAKLLKYSV